MTVEARRAFSSNSLTREDILLAWEDLTDSYFTKKSPIEWGERAIGDSTLSDLNDALCQRRAGVVRARGVLLFRICMGSNIKVHSWFHLCFGKLRFLI